MHPKIIPVLFAGVLFLGGASFAQGQRGSQKPAFLTEAERDGKIMFQQRCPICHTSPLPGDKTYGPLLSADTVAGKEDAIRQIIQKGTARMPGFEYGLSAKEIDDIIAYLKTVKNGGSKPGANKSDSPKPADRQTDQPSDL